MNEKIGQQVRGPVVGVQDTRGFCFVRPLGINHDLFAHISEFNGNVLPPNGAIVTGTVASDPRTGKLRLVNCNADVPEPEPAPRGYLPSDAATMDHPRAV